MSANQMLILYLGAFAFWLQISLGSLGIVLIHEVTGGEWGSFIKPRLLRVFPLFRLLALAFVPVLVVASRIYPEPRSWFFVLRSVVYIAIWLGIVNGYRKRLATGRSLKVWSGGSLMALLFSISFASMDWFMTLDAGWTSTGYGVIFIASCLGAGFAFGIIAQKDSSGPLKIDFGNLLLMAVMLWAYVDFMQYLIIWSGQIPKETEWFARRTAAGWNVVVTTVAIVNLALPFLALLFRRLKKQEQFLSVVCICLLSGRFLETTLWVAPAHGLSAALAIPLSLLVTFVFGLPWIQILIKERP